jgi:hypothetical protein
MFTTGNAIPVAQHISQYELDLHEMSSSHGQNHIGRAHEMAGYIRSLYHE